MVQEVRSLPLPSNDPGFWPDYHDPRNTVRTYLYNPAQTYVPLACVDQPNQAEEPAETIYYYHTDQIDTPTAMTDEEGKPCWAALETDIRGPTKLRKSKVIEYFLWIPFVPNQTYEEQLRHVFKHIEESLIKIFQKNHGDPTGIHETMMALIDHALAHPELYQGDIPK